MRAKARATPPDDLTAARHREALEHVGIEANVGDVILAAKVASGTISLVQSAAASCHVACRPVLNRVRVLRHALGTR